MLKGKMVRVFTGSNNHALKNALGKTKVEFAKEHGDLALEIIDGDEAEFAQVLAAVESVPLLATKKMVIVYSLSTIKEAGEQIENLVNSAGDTELIIVEPKPDKRSTYYKYLKKNTELVEFNELDERELANWLAAESKKAGVRLGFSDAHYLVQRVGANQEMASNELKKLINYDSDISKTTIDKLTEASPQTSIFNLLDSAFAGNTKKAVDIYDEQRTQGEEPLKIFAMLVWQMHLVALVDSAGNRNDSEIMNSSGLKPFTLNKSRSIARRMGKAKIREVLADLVELDRRLKYTSADQDDAIKELLTNLQG